MARSKETFERRERERAKKAKADAKRARRLLPGEEGEAEEVEAPQLDEGEVLAAVAALTAEFEDGSIAFEDFEEERAKLLSQLRID